MPRTTRLDVRFSGRGRQQRRALRQKAIDRRLRHLQTVTWMRDGILLVGRPHRGHPHAEQALNWLLSQPGVRGDGPFLFAVPFEVAVAAPGWICDCFSLPVDRRDLGKLADRHLGDPRRYKCDCPICWGRGEDREDGARTRSIRRWKQDVCVGDDLLI